MFTRGFTLLESVLVIAAMGALAGVGYIAFSDVGTTASSTKIQSDVSALNAAVTLYGASGGDLSNATSPSQVLAKLKTQRTAASAATSASPLTGSMIDLRLIAEMQTVMEASTTQARALWNDADKRFEVRNSGVIGVKRFRLDPSLSDAEIITEARGDQFYAFNGNTGWVWDTGAKAGGSVSPDDVLLGPSEVDRMPFPDAPVVTSAPVINAAIISPSAPTGSFGGEFSAMLSGLDTLFDGGGSSTGALSSEILDAVQLGPERLPRPEIDKPGGGYLLKEFPLEVQIRNEGAYEKTGKLIFRRDWDAWQPYKGKIIVQEDERLSVKAVSVDPEAFSDSYEVVGSYYASAHIFSGVTEGKYTDVKGGPALFYSLTENGAFLSHGRPVVVIGGQVFDGGEANTLKYMMSQFSGVTAGVPFRIGDLLYHNGTTYDSTHATSTVLHIDVVFTQPYGAKELDIPLNLVNTVNSEDADASADYVQLSQPAKVFPLEIDGRLYDMTIAFGQSDAAGFSTPTEFHTYEGQTARAAVMATLTDRGPKPGGNQWGDWMLPIIQSWLTVRGYL